MPFVLPVPFATHATASRPFERNATRLGSSPAIAKVPERGMFAPDVVPKGGLSALGATLRREGMRHPEVRRGRERSSGFSWARWPGTCRKPAVGAICELVR